MKTVKLIDKIYEMKIKRKIIGIEQRADGTIYYIPQAEVEERLLWFIPITKRYYISLTYGLTLYNELKHCCTTQKEAIDMLQQYEEQCSHDKVLKYTEE